jgi:hypothetical protein
MSKTSKRSKIRFAIFLVGLGSILGVVIFETMKTDIAKHNIIECEIFDMDGRRIWTLPGALHCTFYENGDVLAYQSEQLIMYDENLHVLWKKDVLSHHQINTTNNEILVLSSELIEDKKQPVRFDKLVVLNRSGDIVKEFRVADHKHDWYSNESYWDLPEPYQLNNLLIKKEFSHFNSFYRIPENKIEKTNPEFSSKNYIVTDFRGKIFILDQNLQKTLWQLYDQNIRAHDAQFTPDGKIIYYLNYNSEYQNFSSLDELNPLTLQKRILYKGSPTHSFSNRIKGGLQILPNGNILTSSNSSPPMAFEIEPKTQSVIWTLKNPQLTSIQQIKRAHLNKFLIKNRGL